MSHTVTSSPIPDNNNRRNNFASPQSLSDWPKPRLPSNSFASWGIKPDTKKIHNLWLELLQGETSLDDSNPPVLTVQVVKVLITGKDGKFLLESHHELSNDKVSQQNRPLTEKMKPNEDPESTALRGIKEELGSVLGVGLNTVAIDRDSYEMRIEERDSETYPGLLGCYVFHTFYATVEGLLEGDFFSHEVDEYDDSDDKKVTRKAVSVKKHYWKWVSADSIQP